MEIDDRLTLPGAEGIDLDLVLAGIGSRGAALFVDLVVQGLIFFAVVLVAVAAGDPGVAIEAIGAFFVVFGYPILLEAFNGGRTLGKQAVGIAVVSADGSPASFLSVTIRNVVRIVIDLLPGVYTVGLIAMFVTERTQRVGDLAGRTIVVRRGRSQVTASPYDAGLTAPAGLDAAGGPSYGPPPPGSWGGPPAWGASSPPRTIPPEIAHWDTSALTLDEVAAVRAFLFRRHQIAMQHRNTIAITLAEQLRPKVAGIPLDGGPELLLERIAYARMFR